MDKICRYCGRRILFVPGPAGPFPVDAELTPFRTAVPGEGHEVMFHASGGRYENAVPCTDEEAEGYAHRFHFVKCSRKLPPRKNDKRPGMRR